MTADDLPPGAQCEADHRYWKRCPEEAVTWVLHQGVPRMVCLFHQQHYHPAHGRTTEAEASPDDTA
jgi:hypothetical protein